jgi:protein-disulfide isomerase
MTDTLYKRSLSPLTAFAGLALLAVLAGCTDENASASDTETRISTEAQGPAPEIAMGDMMQGNPNSPVTVIEYASMTCSHCAGFHKHTYPRLKENYIDTGKINFVFREFPLDAYALEASIMARCAGEDRYFEIVHEVFERQEEWILASSPSKIRNRLRGIGEDLGITESMYKTCQDDEALQKRIAAKAAEGRTRYDVNGTPAIVVNGQLVEGGANYNNLARHIEGLLESDQ